MARGENSRRPAGFGRARGDGEWSGAAPLSCDIRYLRSGARGPKNARPARVPAVPGYRAAGPCEQRTGAARPIMGPAALPGQADSRWPLRVAALGAADRPAGWAGAGAHVAQV